MNSNTQVSGVAKNVIEKCGGFKRTAELVGRTVSWVYRWTYPKEKGGTGGVIPHEDAQTLLKAARSQKIKLTPSDFFEHVD